MSRATHIRPRRRIADLYVWGKEVRFSPDGAAVYEHKRNRETKSGERVLITVYETSGKQQDILTTTWEDGEDDLVFWVQAPNTHQREQALRESQGERARAVLRARRDEESPEKVTIESFVSDMTLDTLIEYILASDEASRREEAQRNVLLRDEWKASKSKDEDPTKISFTELQDAMRQWDEAGRPETDEWQPLIDRDTYFGEQVQEEVDRLRDASRESLQMLDRSELEDRAKRRRIEMVGNQAFMARYEREMLFAAVRDFEKRDQFYYDSVDDMLEEDEFGLDVLADVYGLYIQDARDAKNVLRAAPGSASAEPPAEQETSEASTPQEPTE